MAPLPVVNRNVVLLPDADVTKEAIRQSNRLRTLFKKADLITFCLNEKKFLPHITLHQFALPEYRLDELREVVSSIAANQTPFRVNMGGYSLFGGTGVFWDVDVNNWPLRDLHTVLVQTIKPLQEGLIMKQHAGFAYGDPDIGLERRRSLLQWGNPLAMEAFCPHITLTACRTPKAAWVALEVLQKLGPVISNAFDAVSLHITEVGPQGSCPGSLEEFQFTGHEP